jgi:hypothetical protein
MDEEVPVNGDVSATCLVRSAAVPDELGLSVGNRLEALPPGLSVGLVVLETPSGERPDDDGVEVTPNGLCAARMLMEADACGSVRTLAALPMADRLTEETVVAVRGTVNCAWSCRCAEAATTAPRLHEEVPSSLPQPELNSGVPAPVGDVRSWSVAAGTVPPVAQADTVHWVTCPRLLLSFVDWTSTHKSTCAAAVAAVKTMA